MVWAFVCLEQHILEHNYLFIYPSVFPHASAPVSSLSHIHSKELINQAIENLGGRVVQTVTLVTTHCLCGRDGVTEWGQKTGKGSQKYKDVKKKVLLFDSFSRVVGFAQVRLFIIFLSFLYFSSSSSLFGGSYSFKFHFSLSFPFFSFFKLLFLICFWHNSSSFFLLYCEETSYS